MRKMCWISCCLCLLRDKVSGGHNATSRSRDLNRNLYDCNVIPIKEFRCIIFNEHEVISAVVERRRRAKVKLPPGTILNLKYSSVGKNQIVTTIRVVDDHGKEEPLVIHTSELVAACAHRLLWE